MNWYRSLLLDDILPHWLAAAPTPSGLFLPHFDRRWQPTGKTHGTIVSQSRLLYNFACGYRLTGNRAYREAVESGAAFLVKRFRDRDHGGWFWAVDSDRTVLDTKKDCYGHAFALFGLCHAWSVLSDERLREEALHTWDILRERFREPGGGFVAEFDRGFSRASDTRSQNPLMHLFEALLAAADTGLEPGLLAEAGAVGSFVLGLRDAAGCLPEVFDRQWHLLPGTHGGRYDIGHAFEWAYLLSRANQLGLPAHLLATGREFLDYGMGIGLDTLQGGIFSPAGYDGVAEKRTGWWEQCEAVRALQHYVTARGAAELTPALDSCVAFVQNAFVDLEYGGWYSEPSPKEGTDGQGKGSEWKVDYHVVGMCIEGL